MIDQEQVDEARADIATIRRKIIQLESELDDLTTDMYESGGDTDALISWAQDFSVQKFMGGGDGVSLEDSSSGTNLYVDGRWDAIFDIFEITATSFSIRGTNQPSNYEGMAWVAGVWKSIGATNLTWDSTDNKWESGDLTSEAEDKWVYLEMDRSENTVTIIMEGSLPGGADPKYDYTEVVPLWYVPWNSGQFIDIDNIEDMRYAARLPAMA